MIQIDLKTEEALVLFEFLSRIDKSENIDLFEDQAEQRVLWDIIAILEKQLSEPLLEDYKKRLDTAREKIRD